MLGLYFVILISLCSCSPFKIRKRENNTSVMPISYIAEFIGIGLMLGQDSSSTPYDRDGALPPEKDPCGEKWAYPLLNEIDLEEEDCASKDRPDPSAPPPPYSNDSPPPYPEA